MKIFILQVARSKRVSGKIKEPTTSLAPVKSSPVVNGVIPLQLTHSPPHPIPPPSSPPPPLRIPKSATRSDLSDQRQHQQDMSRSSDSINDQQWHMVSSNRGLRKGTTTTTSRRETTDESQPTNRTNKTPLNNAGKNISYILNEIHVVHDFVFHFGCGGDISYYFSSSSALLLFDVVCLFCFVSY